MTISLTCACGSRLEIDEVFAGQTITCPDCQRRLQVPKPEPAGIRTSGLALLSLLLALVGAFTLVGTVVAVALGAWAQQQIKRSPEAIAGRNYALAGIILGILFTGLTGFALFAPELFGLQNLPGQFQWAGKLDYDVPEEIVRPTEGYAIKRPSPKWGVRRSPKIPDLLDFEDRSWDELLLVHVPEDAHILVRHYMVTKDYTLEMCCDLAVREFRDRDPAGLFGQPRPKVSRSARCDIVEKRRLPDLNETQTMELLLDKTFLGQERRFLMRVVRERDVVYVVVGGKRKDGFARIEEQVREALGSFRVLPPGPPG